MRAQSKKRELRVGERAATLRNAAGLFMYGCRSGTRAAAAASHTAAAPSAAASQRNGAAEYSRKCLHSAHYALNLIVF